jgi:hypothetical protein
MYIGEKTLTSHPKTETCNLKVLLPPLPHSVLHHPAAVKVVIVNRETSLRRLLRPIQVMMKLGMVERMLTLAVILMRTMTPH